jgi:hypothetical protein
MSPSEAMCKHTASEFVEWKVKIRDEVHAFHRDDWNFAQLAYRLYCLEHRVATLFAKNAQSPKLEIKEFLIKFKEEQDDAKVEELVAKYDEMTEEECLEDPVYKAAYDAEMQKADMIGAAFASWEAAMSETG